MELEKRIQSVIAETIRPALQGHGGDIDFVSFDAGSGLLKVFLKGACGTCPFAQETLRVQVEKVLKEEFPEITAVERA
jgi:Fe-S cluster biogenesis protein NfuA